MSHHINLTRIKGVANALDDLKNDIAFVGGATVSLYADHPEQTDTRPTDDAEACKRISAELQTRHPQVAWQGVRRFRNYIAHDYFGMDIDIVWQSLITELPKLKVDLLRVLEED